MYAEVIYTLTDRNGIAKVLEFAPDGWDDMTITEERSSKFYGIFRYWSIPMKFTKDGATILRTEYYTHGLNSVMYLTIQKLDKYKLVYTTEFTGEIDWATFKDLDDYVDILASDSGLSKKMKDQGSQELNIRFTEENTLFFSLPVTSFGDEAVPEPLVPARKIKDVITDVLQFLSNTFPFNQYLLKSSLLDEYDEKILITNGYCIYDGDLNNNIIYNRLTITLDDLLQAINAWTCIGVGVEVKGGIEQLVIERRGYFYQGTETADVGEVKALSLTPATSMVANTFKFGFPGKDFEDPLRNFWETNGTNKMANYIRYKGEYDAVSKYRADYHGMMVIYEGSLNGEMVDEDAIFFAQVVDWEGGLRMQQGLIIKGTPHGEQQVLYNAHLTPWRCAKRHIIYWLCNILVDFPDDPVQPTSLCYDERHNITVDGLEGTQVEEGSLIETETLRSFFRPMFVEFEAPYPPNFLHDVHDRPHGFISFTYEGVQMRGYLEKLDIRVASDHNTKYKLLLSSSSDISGLIR
jgi:hypothetical protein